MSRPLLRLLSVATHHAHPEAIATAGAKKDIESLAALEHGGITYAPFNKDFYEVAPDIAAMPLAEVRAAGGS